ncbi:hypothetical protein [Serratia ficaria]|uniref:hypothetical protein n=1 Tax=Serratia ficaria TaxID=61651 RepID=UPI002183FF93|nr:hypothetical protein [Serratia ficaria]CAI2535862.1 Uncharacterised protein [Serratia ficaria]
MAKIQARNVDDALFALIEQTAMKNERSLEGEIRFALRAYYQSEDAPAASDRENWQQETGQRLTFLFDRLMADNYFREFAGARPIDTFDLVRLARQLNTSPGLLMDIMAGRQELTFSLADKIAQNFDASADWLLGGSGSPFEADRIGADYPAFFRPDNGKRYVFELHRIDGGRFDGTLFVLRQDLQTQQLRLGVVTEQFNLSAGMGGTGHANLKDFLLFLKTDCGDMQLNAFRWQAEAVEYDFWELFGRHHPRYFQNPAKRSSADWLQRLLQGEDPGGWFKGWSPCLVEIAATPFGESAAANVQEKPHGTV